MILMQWRISSLSSSSSSLAAGTAAAATTTMSIFLALQILLLSQPPVKTELTNSSGGNNFIAVEGWVCNPQSRTNRPYHHPHLHQVETTKTIRKKRIVLFQATVSSSSSSSSRPPRDVTLPDTSTPLPPHTFSGMVERRLLEKFGSSSQGKDERTRINSNSSSRSSSSSSSIDRVIQSWRLLDQEYYHKQYVGDDDDVDDDDGVNGVTGRPSMIQECHSYVPGLSVRPFWDKTQFDWVQVLESRYDSIKEEFQKVTSNMSKLQREGNNIWAGALTDDASSYGVGWKTLVLMDRGRWDPTNTRLFPQTAQAVYDSGVPATEVFFASMEPDTSIKTHTDFTNFVLTSHLPIDVPYSGQNKCRLTIGNETRQWINGQIMVFDTSLEHDAINESDKTRYILMMRLWHPDLSEQERQALQFTFDALEIDGLVSPDEGQRYMAEQTVEMIRKFPLLDDDDQGKKGSSTSSRSGGFGIGSTSNSVSGASGSKKNKSKNKKSKANKNTKPAKGFGR